MTQTKRIHPERSLFTLFTNRQQEPPLANFPQSLATIGPPVSLFERPVYLGAFGKVATQRSGSYDRYDSRCDQRYPRASGYHGSGY